LPSCEKIFEPKSILQKIAESFSFAEKYLDLAYENRDNPIDCLKFVIVSAISGLYSSANHLKPFNPLLGETFEGKFNKISVYCEQISHYPSIIRFFLKHSENKYRVYGYFELINKQNTFGSIINFIQKGPVTVDFGENNKISYILPKIKLLNCRNHENRSVCFKGRFIFAYPKHDLKAIITIGKAKNINDFSGVIQNYKYERMYKFAYDNEKAYGKSKKAKENVIGNIKGSWLDSIIIDNNLYWNILSDFPINLIPNIYPLPSDTRFREDAIWLFRSINSKNKVDCEQYEEFSQTWKSSLEQRQRKDRELRKKK